MVFNVAIEEYMRHNTVYKEEVCKYIFRFNEEQNQHLELKLIRPDRGALVEVAW